MHRGALSLAWLLSCSCLALPAAYSASCDTYAWDAGVLQRYCGAQHSSAAYRSPACSVHRLCSTASSGLGGLLCSTQRLFTTLCLDQPDLLECKSFLRLISSDEDYSECLGGAAIRVWSTRAAESFMSEACAPGRDLAGCDECNAGGCDTPDPLLAYAAACTSAHLEPTACAPLAELCSSETGAVAKALCSARREHLGGDTSASASTRGVAAATGAATLSSSSSSLSSAVLRLGGQAAPPPPPTNPCVADSTQPACRSYTYPDTAVQADIGRLCDSMPDMPGCAIARACEAQGRVADKYCRPFVLLATLCADMPGMRGCENYKALCRKPGSVVEQCTSQPAVPGSPTWSQARKAVFSACEDHPMAGCANCSRSDCPDPLASLADICHEMPAMSVCKGFWAFCSAAGAEDVAEWCAEDSSKYLPSMLMYFHQRTEELLLWKEWRPRTQGQYVASVIAIVVMGVVATGLKTAKGALVLRWNHDRALSGQQAPRVTSVWAPKPGQLGEILAKSSITGVSLTLDYFNMLIAMTFNVGFFCAVIAGYIAGTLVFGHVLENYGAMLHQERRDAQQKAAVARNGLGVTLEVNGVGACKGGPGGGFAAVSESESEERLLVAAEEEGECHCVHSA